VLPEINFARRLIDRERLSPPVDIVAVARKFAAVEQLRFPRELDVDGVCLNLKRRGYQPRIIVNIAGRTKERIRFTLAHELGHVIIPWHTGSIVDTLVVDTIDADQDRADPDYWALEGEANRFAAELLMPIKWVNEIVEEFSPPDAINHIVRSAEVSRQAAMIRVNACQKPGIVYVQLQNGIVVASGRSNATLANPPPPGTPINPRSLFPWTPHRWQVRIGGVQCFWWQFKGDVSLPTENTNDDWRRLLNEIIENIMIQEHDVSKFKSRVNGIISYANSQVKSDRTSAKIFEACLVRIHGKAGEDSLIRRMIEHPLFQRFLYARVLDLIE
jgi:hypothetical protein